MEFKKLNARAVYLIYSAASALFFAVITTLNLVYQAQVVNLNPLQLVLVGTLLESTIFLLEIPTGVVADVYSRRLSVIIGVCLMGVGFVIEGSIPRFWPVMLSQVLWGAGYTFTSGAAEAWISDEVGEENAGQVFVRGSQAALAGGIAGAAVSAALGSIRVNVPIITGGVCYLVLGLFLAVWMPERGFVPRARQNRPGLAATIEDSWKGMARTFLDGLRLVRGRWALLTILLAGLFFGLYSEGFDRLWTPHLLRDIGLPALGSFKPVVWFGVISIGGQALSLGAIELARRRLSPDNPRLALRTLLVSSAFRTAALVALALAGNFPLALAALAVIQVSRGLNGPYYTAWVNRHLTSGVRATVLSMSSQVDAAGQILGGPILGAIGSSVSIPAALLGSAALLSPVLVLFSREVQKEKGDMRESRIESQQE